MGGDYAYAYGRGEATLTDGSWTRGSSDMFQRGVPAIVPRRLEARLSPLPWMDVGGQIGWIGGGAELRLGLPATPERLLAFNLATGFESGKAGPFWGTKKARLHWVRAEAYPAIPRLRGQMRLIFAAGLGWGDYYHELDDPHPDELVGDGLAPSIVVVRRETRLETAVGAFGYVGTRAVALFTINPYVVLDSGAPLVGPEPSRNTVVGYRQNWGIAFVLSGALTRRVLGRNPASFSLAPPAGPG